MNNIDIKEIGIISSIPHICAIVSYPLCGYIADYLRKDGRFSPTQVHKLYIVIGFLVGIIVFAIAGSWSSFVVSIICFSFFKFFISCTELTLQVISLDMAPRYAALLAGIANSFLTTGAIVSPTVAGYLTTNHTAEEWKLCFILLSVVYLLGMIVFLFLGSGELQPWAEVLTDSDDQNVKYNGTHLKNEM